MTQLLEALQTLLVDEGYWAIVVSVVSVGGGGYLINKAKVLIATIIGQLPSLVKEVMLRTLNIDDKTAKEWYQSIEDERVARKLILEKELQDIEIKIGSPLLNDGQRAAYEELKKAFILEIERITAAAVGKAVDEVKKLD
jgi:hypothetical protein